MLLHLDVVACVSPMLPKLNVVVLAESCVILLLCLILAGYQFVLYTRHRYVGLMHGMICMLQLLLNQYQYHSIKIDEDHELSKMTLK